MPPVHRPSGHLLRLLCGFGRAVIAGHVHIVGGSRVLLLVLGAAKCG